MAVVSAHIFSTLALAQYGKITGRVSDPTGAMVRGTNVEVRNVATGVVFSVATNETGYYSVPLLPPGEYQVSVAKAGFRLMTRRGIRLEVHQVARVDFVLALGEVAESVDVVGAAPLVSTEEASLGTSVYQRQIQQLPLNGRNPFSLVTLVPGVTSDKPGRFGRKSNINGA